MVSAGLSTPRSRPVVFVMGCTGTGKTDVGVRLAERFNGEVISADSMQIYQGLDIVTNKVTPEEAHSIPHHLIGFLSAKDHDRQRFFRFNVHDFRRLALPIIDRLHEQGKLPIIVGGTSYYVESLLYTDTIVDVDANPELEFERESLSNEELWRKLETVDPEAAWQVHPNNRARVERALEIFERSKRTKSDWLRDQKPSASGLSPPGSLRWPSSLVVQLDAEKPTLAERLDRRVEKMRIAGMRDEIESFYREHVDVLKIHHYGVRQCIGFREFWDYLEMDTDRWRTPEGDAQFEKGIEEMKLHTRQYSRRQRNWARQRILGGDREKCPVIEVDTTDPRHFLDDVERQVSRFLAGREIVTEESSGGNAENKSAVVYTQVEKNKLYTCETCQIAIQGRRNWDEHISGKRHRKCFASKKRKAEDNAVSTE